MCLLSRPSSIFRGEQLTLPLARCQSNRAAYGLAYSLRKLHRHLYWLRKEIFTRQTSQRCDKILKGLQFTPCQPGWREPSGHLVKNNDITRKYYTNLIVSGWTCTCLAFGIVDTSVEIGVIVGNSSFHSLKHLIRERKGFFYDDLNFKQC